MEKNLPTLAEGLREMKRIHAYLRLQQANKAFEEARANKAAALKAYFATTLEE